MTYAVHLGELDVGVDRSLCSVPDGVVPGNEGIIRNPAHSGQSYNHNDVGVAISVCKNPLQVSLRIRGSHFCAAAILTDHWLLTAAHCFASVSTDFLHKIEAVAGEFNQRKVDRGEQNFHVRTVMFHEKYQRTSPMSYDIALIEISGRIHFGDFIKPVCLPHPGERFPPKTMCVVGGWGRITERGPLPSVLQEVHLDLLEQSKCKHVLQTLRPGQKTFTVLCAGPETGRRDACQGDSGGPLLCSRADGSWVAVGVTSWGKGCGRSWNDNKNKPSSRRGSPGVFTDVLMFLPWIKSNLRKELDVGVDRSLCSVPDGVVPGNEGIIRNPAHSGQSYNHNEMCLWSIRVAAGEHILLEFLEFDLENDTECQSDHLTVYVDEDRRIGQFCGSQSPSPILIGGSHSVTVQFVSDVSRTGAGFAIQISGVGEDYSFGDECGTVVLLQPKGAVQSPAYPQAYSNNTLCRWVIYAPEGHIVKLDFEDFDLEESENCKYDSLTVFGDVDGKDEIVVVCGRSVPPAVLSHNRIMLLQFSTDNTISARGFNATLSFISEKDLQNTAYEDQGEEADDDSEVITPHSQAGLSFVLSTVLQKRLLVSEGLSLCGMPDIFAACGLETLRREEDDGKLPWLWHVSIGLGEGHDCSGALIQSQWILTDAHCVNDLEERLLRILSVKIGGSKKQVNEISFQTCDVIRVHINPYYNPSSPEYNVALLQLSSLLNLSESAHPVCLPSAGHPPSAAGLRRGPAKCCMSPVFLHVLTIVIVELSELECHLNDIIFSVAHFALCGSLGEYYALFLAGHGQYRPVRLKISVLEQAVCEQQHRTRLTPTLLCAGLSSGESCMVRSCTVNYTEHLLFTTRECN
ncbi:ovochymase-2-like [Megalobrama amblycephala]|uniref:ovochymase-2-like n=1 Tax=Megalobrama amblycephala TaxID=75352 RepID=UPI0020143D4C|nr:ovochymase-2-like [Megalobrama amblycephala]